MSSVRGDVDRGLEIRAQMAQLKEELDEIEGRLQKAGLAGDHIDLNDPEREGKQWIAKGSTAEVPVVFTSDLLMKSFQDESMAHARIAAVAGSKLGDFFKPITTWKTLCDNPVVFRRNAAAILGEKGPEFVSACLMRDRFGVPKSNIRIEWERAK